VPCLAPCDTIVATLAPPCRESNTQAHTHTSLYIYVQGVLPEELIVKPPSYFQAQVAKDKSLPPSVC